MKRLKKSNDFKESDNFKRLEAFKKVKSLDQVQGPKSEFEADEILIFRVFDKVKVRVDTTTEFPLDISCSLIFND